MCKKNEKITAETLANWIISKTDSEHGDCITNLKLQKLMYYMQGFHLAIFNSPLFDSNIKAWQYGPVVPEIYYKFKQYEANAIPVEEYNEFNIENLSSEQKKMLDNVYSIYAQFSPIKLMNMTHEESPWKETEKGKTISHEKMKKFFKTRIE